MLFDAFQVKKKSCNPIFLGISNMFFLTLVTLAKLFTMLSTTLYSASGSQCIERKTSNSNRNL